MLIGDRVLGLIAVQSVKTPNVYDEHHRDILTTIASQAAIAIENARLFQEAQRRAQETAALA
jgi:GAF domain-containing protein